MAFAEQTERFLNMAYIPDTATWYIAEIVEEISVETDPRKVIHRNTVLMNATSPEEAYSRSIELGKATETSYENPAGNRVSVRFRGLRDLIVVHDRLEHGAELFFEEFIDVSEQQVQSWLRSKEE